MERTDNYARQAMQAKQGFLRYDQQKIIQKLRLTFDGQYLYPVLLGQTYRINRTTADMERRLGEAWVDANTHVEVMTLLDLLCDSREDRCVSGKWKNMASFGLMFHQNLLENARDPWAEKFQNHPEAFRRACLTLGGRELPTGDIAYAIDVFDGLEIAVQLWFGDEEFSPNLRWLWDENATMYLKYETMFYARSLLLRLLEEAMA